MDWRPEWDNLEAAHDISILDAHALREIASRLDVVEGQCCWLPDEIGVGSSRTIR